jgi:hypothetical protein
MNRERAQELHWRVVGLGRLVSCGDGAAGSMAAGGDIGDRDGERVGERDVGITCLPKVPAGTAAATQNSAGQHPAIGRNANVLSTAAHDQTYSL